MKNKFNAKKVEYDGYTFDSKKEFEYYLVLNNRLKNKEINDLDVHPKFTIIDGNHMFKEVIYKADFSYMEKGLLHVDDVKGLRKGSAYSLFKLKQKLMYDRYGILVEEI